ncbi:MAG: EF-hand domain-containing protein [Desulfosarcina sp.]
MKIAIASLFFTIFLTAAVGFSSADEKRDHVCFRVLDSNKDGVVTYPEFEKIYSDEKDKYDAADLDNDGKLTHDEYHDLLGHGNT